MCGQQIACNVSVKGFLADIEMVRVIGDDVVCRLTSLEQRADKLVESTQFILRDIGSGSGFNEYSPV